MALVILQPNATSSKYQGSGSDVDNVFGSTGNETVWIAANGKVVLDPSFSAGGDKININGNAGDYRAHLSGSNLVLTSTSGANIVIPAGRNGVDITFNDGVRELVIEGGAVHLGDQTVPGTGSIVVEPGNRAPVFSDDEISITTARGTAFNDSLVGAAADPDGDALTYSLASQASNGTVVVNANGTYTYTPNSSFVGNDSYVVRVTDAGGLTDTVVVRVVVTPTEPDNGGVVRLSVGEDYIVPGSGSNQTTNGDDVIRARVAQNSLGDQTNQLGSGDYINGGGGQDTLDAWIQGATPRGGSVGSTAIAPETTDVEIVNFRAVKVAGSLSNVDPDDLPALFFGEIGPRIGVQVDASDMFGVEEIGSVQSDESLTIYDLTTLNDDGVTFRATADMTIRMDHTGNNTSIGAESDLTVLFDRDYLICENQIATGGQLYIEMMDLDASRLLDLGFTTYPAGRSNAGQPILGQLHDSPYFRINFQLGGEQRSLDIGTGYNSYADLLNAVQLAIASQPDLNGSTGGVELVATLGPVFTANDTDGDPGGSSQGRTIVLTNIGNDAQFSNVTLDANFNGVPGEKDFHLQPYFTPPEGAPCVIEVDVVLNKVGRGGDGGELTIGGMVPNLDNVWDKESESGLSELPRGVQKFNVTVEGNDSQDSSLAAIRSTDNWLETIIINDEGTALADLVIGNRNTAYDGFDPIFANRLLSNIPGLPNGLGEFSIYQFLNNGGLISQVIGQFVDLKDPLYWDLSTAKNNAVKDVLTFDASKFDNDTEVHGFFSDEVVDKYLTLTDSDPSNDNMPNATTDNPDGLSVWTFGEGKNIVNLNINQTNLAVQGSATREDFQFNLYTNGGDDLVQIQLGDGKGSEAGDRSTGSTRPDQLVIPGAVDHDIEPWYVNHLLNQNLFIDTGSGNDKIELWGSSAAVVKAGAGSDIIFTDNSGGATQLLEQYTTALLLGTLTGREVFNDARATWVFNSTNTDVDNLNSFAVGSIARVADLQLTVQYMDFLVKVEVGGSYGSVTGVTITDLDVVQAIKAAINNNSVLSAFLVAEDGPGRTLVVRSLVDGITAETDLTFTLGDNGVAKTVQQLANPNLNFFADLTATQLNSIGFETNGYASDGLGEYRFDAQFGTQLLPGSGIPLQGFNSDYINNNRVEGGTGNDNISLSTNEASIEHLVITGVFSSLAEAGLGDHVLNFDVIGQEYVAVDGSQETQTITFTGTAEDDFVVEVVLDGVVNPILISVDTATYSTAAQVAGYVASQLNGTNGLTASVSGGVVTILYNAAGNPDQVIVNIVEPAGTETQAFNITGSPPTATTVTVSFAGETFVVPILAGSTPGAIEQEIVSAIQNAGITGITASLNSGSANTAGVDGQFSLIYTGNDNPDQATFTWSPAANAPVVAYDGLESTLMPDFDGGTLAVTTATTIPGVDPVDGYVGQDIIDLSAIIGAGAPGYFDNDQQANGQEAGSITALITSGANGVILIDTVDTGEAAGATELARIQTLVTAADSAGQSGTNTSVIITVSSNPGNGPSTADSDGTYGDFYKVVDGVNARDATVSYLGRIYLGGSDLEDQTGNYDYMTIANFTPLSPTELYNIYDAAGFIV